MTSELVVAQRPGRKGLVTVKKEIRKDSWLSEESAVFETTDSVCKGRFP